MSDEKSIFLSYSREDSKFALRFAKDLKKSGLNVWIDQLDIPGGEHWDDNIERALENSCVMIVILSPSSVKSRNVKDEVSYALDNDILTLPIRYKDTKIPYQWTRLQSTEINEKNYDKEIDGFIETIIKLSSCEVKDRDFITEDKKAKKSWFTVAALLSFLVAGIMYFVPKIDFFVKKTEDTNTTIIVAKQTKVKEPIKKQIEVKQTVKKIEKIIKEKEKPIQKSLKKPEKKIIKIPDIVKTKPIVKTIQKQKITTAIIEPSTQTVSQPFKQSDDLPSHIDRSDPYADIFNRYIDELKKDKSTKLIIISHTNLDNAYDEADDRAYKVSLELRKRGLKRSNMETKIEQDQSSKITFDFKKVVN